MLELEKSVSTSMARKTSLTFRPWQDQCSMIRIKYEPNPQGIKEVEIQPQLVDSLVKKTKKIKRGRSQRRTT